MISISDLLKKHIEANGYTIYSISRRSGINRTTLTKILAGQRKCTKEIYETLLSFLHPSVKELDELNNAFLISQIGEARYQCHMQIKNLLESPIPVQPQNSFSLSYDHLAKDNFPKSFCMTNKIQILNTICALVKQSMSSTSKSYLYTYADFQDDYIASLCSQFNTTDFQSLEIKHLIEFSKITNIDDNYDNLYNQVTLTNLIPFISQCTNQFSIYYYYASENQFNKNAVIFPYYIIIPAYIIMLSKDYTTAFFISDSTLHEHYSNKYNIALKQADVLTDGHIPHTALLEYLIVNDASIAGSVCLNAQPSIEAFIDNAMIDKYMREIPDMDLIKERFKYRISQLRTNGITTLFTIDGLRLFAAYGKCTNIHDYMAEPFDIADRIKILERIIASCSKGASLKLINNSKFAFGLQLSAVPLGNDKFLLVIASPNNTVTTIQMQEHTLYNSFMDFINNIQTYEFTYTVEQTIEVLQSTIDELKTML